MKTSGRIIIGLAITAVVIPVVASAITSDVFRVEMTIRGVIQRGALIPKVMITSDDLINLAQHRVLGADVPNNEMLALVNNCDTNLLRLIIFDTATSSNLVTIGSFSDLRTVSSTRKHEERTIAQLSIPDISGVATNGATNGITGGSLYYHGKITIDTNGCATSFGGQLTGFLDTAFPMICTNINCTNFTVSCTLTNCILTNCMPDCVTNCTTNCTTRLDCTTNIFPCADAITVIIPRAPITTGKSRGKLIEP